LATFVNSRVIRHAQTASRWQSESYLAILSHHDSSLNDGLQGEVAMSTVIDFPHCDNFDRHQLWDRFERADLFEYYLDPRGATINGTKSCAKAQIPSGLM
jgi:hypothetical protein